MKRGGDGRRGFKEVRIEGGASRIRHVQGEVGGGLNDQHEVGLALGEAGLAYPFPTNMSLFSGRSAKPEVPMRHALEFRNRAGTMWELL